MFHGRVIGIVLAVYWVGIFIATHVPVPSGAGGKVNDKLAHFGAYFILAGLLYAAIYQYAPKMRGIGWIVILVAMIYGAADELLQIPVGRSCELGDWIADVAGASAMAGLIATVRRLRRPGGPRGKGGDNATQDAACTMAD